LQKQEVPVAKLVYLFAWIFNVDKEGSIPSLYSSISLIFCASLLGFIAFSKYFYRSKYVLQWFLLSTIFLGAAWDEATQIHERFIGNRLTREVASFLGIDITQVGFASWTIVVLPIVFLGCIFFFKVYSTLPRRERGLVLYSGFFFFSGAVIVELMTSLIWTQSGYDRNTIYWSVMVAIEESLEMLGVAFFIYALLSYIAQDVSQISFRFPPIVRTEMKNFKVLDE